jgi:MurNAc alpha-1-phosphate uridylyltransferase
MQCVILAGGRGTRMEHFTSEIPKSLIPVCGKPFIDYQLGHMARTGVTDVVLCIGYKGDQIRDYVKEGEAWELPVRYVDEGQTLRGTAGALRLALEKDVLDTNFLVTYGDSFLPIDFSSVWRYFEDREEPILMTVYKNSNRWGPSNVIFNGTKVTVYDKDAVNPKDPAMQFIDYGLFAMRKTLIETDIPSGPYNLADLFKQRSLWRDIAGMEVKTRFYEVGSPDGLKELTSYVATMNPRQEPG